MLKLTPVLLALLATTASAAPATYQLALSVRPDGKAARDYTVKVTDRTCGSVKARTSVGEDEIRVCADSPEGNHVTLHVEWVMRADKSEVNTSSTAVVDRGGKLELAGGIAKLQVAIQ